MPRQHSEDNGWISAGELVARAATACAPVIIDVRRPAAVAALPRAIAGARWRAHTALDAWIGELGPDDDVVVYCAHGHNVSQSAVALLRNQGYRARGLRDGIDGYLSAGGVTTAWRAGIQESLQPSRWVTRARPTIDRIACPWLIRRFIDPNAQVLYVDEEQVVPIAEEFSATAFDVEGARFGHEEDRCSFDAFLRLFDIHDSVLDRFACIVRGADTARLDLAPECAGLLAMSQGLCALHSDDLEAMRHGFALYDALYASLRNAHTQDHHRPACAPHAQEPVA